MKVAFDCDGTLKSYDGSLRDEVCQLLIACIASGFEVIVWSGGGQEYAQGVWRRVVHEYNLIEELGLPVLAGVVCKFKDDSKPELAIDDMDVNLGHFNLRWVARVPKEKGEDDV